MKKSVKRAVRVLRARASHGRVRREKPTVRFPYNEFVPTRGFKIVVELSNLDAVSSNSKAVFRIASLWNVVYKVEVAARQENLCLLLEGGVSWWKSQALRINCRNSKHRAEQRLETALRCFPKLEKNWTRQLTMNNYCDWKESVNPLIPIHFFVIWLCKLLSVRI